MLKVIVWGASGHAKVVADIIRSEAKYEIAGFIDNVNPERKGAHFFGAQVLGGEEALPLLYEAGITHLILAFGNCAARLHLAEQARSRGFKLIRAVHPRSVIATDVKIGAGTVVAAGAVINPSCIIGENVIINTSSSVDHDCIIADGAHISPGAHLAGKVRIGRATWVGAGVCVIDGRTVGANTVVGAGAVVVRDLPDNVVAYGNPASVIRTNDVSAG